MARFRRPILAVQVALTLVLASVGAREAAAQDMTDARLFVPVPDGDPKNPSRFRRPSFGNPAGSGAGTTGFVSTNPQRLKQPRAAPAPLPAIVPADQTLHPVYREAAPAARRPVTTTTIVADPALPHLRRQVVRRTPIDEDPFGPLGIRVGSFVLKPSIELVRGYDTNVTRSLTAAGRGCRPSRAQLQVKSDWSRHEFVGSARRLHLVRASSRISTSRCSKRKVNARIDITSQTRADLEGRFSSRRRRARRSQHPERYAEPPIYNIFGGTAGPHASLQPSRSDGEGQHRPHCNTGCRTRRRLDARSLRPQLQSVWRRARVGYEIVARHQAVRRSRPRPPRLRRFHEQRPTRNSQGTHWRVGVEFELTRKLTGEVSVGQVTRDYKDPTLRKSAG